MPPDPATVFVVDDDAAIRDALGNLIRSVGLLPRAFASAHEFLTCPKPDNPACLLLDVRMPGMAPLDCQRLLADAGIPIPIIFMTGNGDIPMSLPATKTGTVDFLTKPFRDQDLLDAVRQALEIDRRRRISEHGTALLQERFESLTEREREILRWVISGRHNKQIAAELATSEESVKVHRTRTMRKMKANSTADLVTMAARLGVPPVR